MKNAFMVLTGIILVTMLGAYSAQAVTLHAYKSTSSKIVKIQDSEVNKVFSDGYASPACLKDGSKIIGVNKAFKAKTLGYRDCSTSDAAKAKQQALGYEVIVIKLEQLSPSLMKKVLQG